MIICGQKLGLPVVNRFFLLIFIQLCLISSYSSAQVKIKIEAQSRSEISLFAQTELKTFLGKGFIWTAGGTPDWKIVLGTDKNLADGSFSINCHVKNKEVLANLTGSNETAMLHAVYTFLEKAGMRFEISGPVLPGKISLEPLKGFAETITPVVKQRGIRQHINFPMDVSSYPIDEAREYIRNLARLRFNYITFHSYPNQWYETEKQDKIMPAGSFFYGIKYNLAEGKQFFKNVRNQNVYCIPAIEPFYDQPQVKSDMAISWLDDLMKECKRVGLTIRFSFEPRNNTTDVTATVKTARTILSHYPQIDEMELITQETGDYGGPRPVKEVEDMLTAQFGKDVLDDPIIMGPVRSGKTGVWGLYAQLGHNIKAYKAIKTEVLDPLGKKANLALYIVVPEYLRSCYQVLRKYAPEASYAVLPAHGARRVTLNLPQAEMTKDEWKKTMIYSWLEFDGIMFLQQNSVRGIRRLIEYGEDINGADGIQGICFNHWRTGENRTIARYAAVSTLYGAQDESTFYTDYASSLGIADAKTYIAAMKKIDDADWYATTQLPNIGFCYAGVWGRKGFAAFGKMNRDKVEQGLQLYQQALHLMQKCALNVSTKAGRDYVAFLDNRLRATVVYFMAFKKGTEIQNYDSEKLTPADRKAIAAICNKSILQFEQCMQIHSTMMPDRGSEGTLVSLYNTPIAVLKRIRNEYGDIPYDKEPVADKTIDAPPAPIKFN